MNPLYLAMMQQQGQQSAPPPSFSLPMSLLPSLPQSSPSSYVNPFDSGIAKAIESARTSIAFSDAQKAQALTASLTALAKAATQASSQTPWGMSQGAGLGHILAQAAPYGVEAYSNAEKQAEQENLGLADYMVKLKSTQDEALRRLLKEQLDRQHQEDVLKETRRHHGVQERKSEALLALKQAKLNKDKPELITLGGKEYSPIASKQEHRLFVNDKKNFGHILKELHSIRKDYDTFREATKENWVDPQAPYYAGALANEAKDFWGSLSGNIKQKQETAKRKALEAKLGKFAVELERKLKGGVLSEGMMKRFENKGLLPSLSDRPEVFDQKLNDLIKEISVYEKAASHSLRTGLIITPLDIEEETETSSQSKNKPASLEGMSTEDLMKELQALEGH